MERTLMLSIMLTMTACAHWVKPGADQAMFNSESAQCQNYAYQQAPVRKVANQSGSSTTCYGNNQYAQCNSQPTNSTPDWAQQDQNMGARESAYKACMYQHGWQSQ